MHLLGAGHDEQTRGIAVQPVDDAGALGIAAGGVLGEQLREGALAVAAGGRAKSGRR